MSFQSSSDYSKEEVLCSKVFSPASFSDDADERANEAAENTSRVGVLGGNLKNATLSQKRKAINRVCPQVCTVCSGPANGELSGFTLLWTVLRAMVALSRSVQVLDN
uniref:NR LBD domain-containing protein n=1 Tax=Parascaris univalens TaxID=6257 RepID=A0A915A7I1_PARUN